MYENFHFEKARNLYIYTNNIRSINKIEKYPILILTSVLFLLNILEKFAHIRVKNCSRCELKVGG